MEEKRIESGSSLPRPPLSSLMIDPIPSFPPSLGISSPPSSLFILPLPPLRRTPFPALRFLPRDTQFAVRKIKPAAFSPTSQSTNSSLSEALCVGDVHLLVFDSILTLFSASASSPPPPPPTPFSLDSAQVDHFK
ncbi:hypothetical protein IE53DRAFT_54681 [Violaceomyces palustris]|uniref:Uncharacterized protein n=1 Tax=Violaceomyces palustris TaxID=1673888 RepID=A0ACD0P056_9BASI|nr:hypothetical protein IE53DRAFT_54681 [Violaceomyces palustris]